MFEIVVMPSEIKIFLPAGAPLTELEYEMYESSVGFGCKAGACGACIIEVLDGLLNLNIKEKNESDFLEMLGFPEAEFRLACQCRLYGAITIRAAL